MTGVWVTGPDAAPLVHFAARQHADFRAILTVYDVDEQPLNLTGFTARFALAIPFETDPVLTLTESAGLTLGGAAGTIGVVITAAQHATLQPVQYRCALVLTVAGQTKDMIFGTYDLKPGVVPVTS